MLAQKVLIQPEVITFDELMTANGFLRSESGNCVYCKWLDSGIGILLLPYMDDMLIASVDQIEIQRLKQQLGRAFEMKD